MGDVRGRALDVLAATDSRDAEDPRARGTVRLRMLIAHEHQHNETMLQLLQMIDG